MVNTNQIAEIGILVGEPARAAILTALLDGRALTASELASVAGVTPQTASGHLARLTTARLLVMEKQGRHRYHRLATPEVARMLEGIMQIASSNAVEATRKIRTGPRDAAMRRARTCYDHFAGRLGVAIADRLVANGFVEFEEEAGLVTEQGIETLQGLGIDITAGTGRRLRSSRPLCRPCLDWSERRPHLAGRLGAEICSHFMGKGYVRRIGSTRALDVTPRGKKALRDMFGVVDLD